jgi:L-ribulose-5-phosphate 3-epimerase
VNTHRFQKGYSLVIRDRQQISGYLPAIAEAGFDGIEPTFVEGAYPSPTEHIERAKELKAACDDLGLLIPSMRGGLVPWDTIPNDDPGERSRALDHTRQALESLYVMGGSVLLVVPGRRVPGVDYHTHWKRVVEYANAAGDLAGEFGMKIGFENVEARFPVSELDWRSLIDQIDSRHVGMYLDVGNVIWLGFGYPEQWIRTLDHRIVQVHFKDATYRLHGATLHAEIRQFLDGDVNWPAVMAALDEVSYRGWIGVEPDSYRHLPAQLPKRLSTDLDALFDSSGGSHR